MDKRMIRFQDLSDREIDALVAEHVFNEHVGCHESNNGSVHFFYIDKSNNLPRYSTNIADAFEVAEQTDLLFEYHLYNTNFGWVLGYETGGYDNYMSEFVTERTASRVICYGALKAKGIVE